MREYKSFYKKVGGNEGDKCHYSTRLDYVRTHYGINHYDDFTMDNLIKNIQEIGKRNKKELVVFQKRTWQHIGRVWFLIEPRKVTEQWD